MNIILIGEKVFRWFGGDKFIFERVGRGEWKCIYQEHPIIPRIIIEDLGE